MLMVCVFFVLSFDGVVYLQYYEFGWRVISATHSFDIKKHLK